MRRTSSTIIALSVLAMFSACTDAGQTLVVLRNQVPAVGCTVPAGATGDFFARGIIDTNALNGYFFTPVVENRATLVTDNGNRLAFVQGAEITLSLGEGFATGTTAFTTRFSGTISPGGTTGFGFQIIPKTVLNEIGASLAPGAVTQVTADITIFGDMDGGEVESQEFTYSVDVCNGCMKVDVGQCEGLPLSFQAQEGGECNLLQDVFLECCTTAEGVERCPAFPGI